MRRMNTTIICQCYGEGGIFMNEDVSAVKKSIYVYTMCTMTNIILYVSRVKKITYLYTEKK